MSTGPSVRPGSSRTSIGSKKIKKEKGSIPENFIVLDDCINSLPQAETCKAKMEKIDLAAVLR